jgi:hypothetical protein
LNLHRYQTGFSEKKSLWLILFCALMIEVIISGSCFLSYPTQTIDFEYDTFCVLANRNKVAVKTVKVLKNEDCIYENITRSETILQKIFNKCQVVFIFCGEIVITCM